MNFNYEKLESIVYEEADVSAVNNTYKTRHMLVIERNGLVTETFFNNKEESKLYKTSSENVKKLYDELTNFIDNIENIELYNDDCTRDVYLNYGLTSIKVPGACLDTNNRKLSELIKSFVSEKCE